LHGNQTLDESSPASPIHPSGAALQPVSVETLINEVIALVEPDARRSGIVCRSDVAAGAIELRADPALLRQALLNLALNGCQAMPNGGKLTMSAKSEKDRRVAITVEDTGVGIPADKLDRIFDLYFTTKPEGSGVGLSIVIA
jgi:signal transduction histidine kinase